MEKAHTRGADAVVLDLEDGVSTSEKHNAHCRVIAAFEEAASTGKCAITVDGKMVDSPVGEGARATLNRHVAIQKRDSGLTAT